MNVYLCEPIAKEAYELLEQHAVIYDHLNCPELIDAILTRNIRVTREMIEQMPNLKVISVHGVGVDCIDMDAALERNILITNTPGQNAQSVAELAVSLILSSLRHVKHADLGLTNGTLHTFGSPDVVGFELSTKKVGIIGSGTIAQKTAHILKHGFSCEVYAYNPHKTEEELQALGFIPCNDLKTLFATMDIISIHCPYTKETVDLITTEIIDAANPNLVLVNTARGGIVSEDTLFYALKNKKIMAVASDVFTEEPLPCSNPLFQFDNFLATFHMGNATKEALIRVGMNAVKNIIDHI